MQIAALACYAAIGGSAVFAWVRGTAAERMGGLLNVATAVLAYAAYTFAPKPTLPTTLLAVDGFLAFGFLALALRNASLWLGGALLFQAAQFSLHGFYLVMHRPFDFIHALANNLDSYGIALCLIVGSIAARRSSGMGGEIGIDGAQVALDRRGVEERAGEAVARQLRQIGPT
jgi:hypothetical protein